MLLSFKPEVFDLISSGKKIYEYRYQFADEPVRAYMYVSKPVQQIIGYIDLDQRILISDWKEKYRNNSDVSKRIDEYLARNNKYVMPIKKFQMTNGLSLEMLESSLKKFIIPQSYYYLDNFPELWNVIRENITENGLPVENKFSEEDIDNICVRNYT